MTNPKNQPKKNTMELQKATPEDCREALEILNRIVSAGRTDDDAMQAVDEGFALIERINRR